MSDRIEAEILDVLGEEVAAAVDTPLVVIEGPKGDPGAPGKDGHSPVVTATKSGKTTTISVDGADIATVEDGADGAPGIYYGPTPPTGDTHPVWIDPNGDHDDGGLLPAVTDADNGKFLRVVNSAWSAEDMPTGGTDMGITGATVGQIAKITDVDASGVPTAWSPADMPSGGSPDALLYTPQTLTDAQKKQARENIDAASSDFVITGTVTGETLTTDKTYEQVHEAVQAGKRVTLKVKVYGIDFVLPLIGENSSGYLFTTTATVFPTVTRQFSAVVGASGTLWHTEQVASYDSDGNLVQISMDRDPEQPMEIATKQYVDDHSGGGTGMGITGAAVGQIAKITAVDASGTPTAWAPVDMPSGGGGGETWELVAEATTTDIVNSLRVTFEACSAVYVEFCWGGVENDLGDIAIYPNTGDTPYAGEKRSAAANVKSSATEKRGMLCVRMDCRVGTYWTAVSNQKCRGDGAFGSINADKLTNIEIGVDSNVQYSVISSYYMTTRYDTPASGVRSITAYGAGMAIGTRLKVWGIKK